MRVRLLKITISICFLCLLLDLAYLQLIRGRYYYLFSEKNRVRLIPLHAPRGNLFDRTGLVLAEDRLSYEACIIPQDAKDPQETFSTLSRLLNISTERLRTLYKKNISLSFVPVAVAQGITKDNALALEEQRHRIPGVTIQTTSKRFYVLGPALSHTIGFLGEIDPEELEAGKTYGYTIKDYVGKAGIEKTFDTYLRGQRGGIQIEVNNLGQQVRILGRKEPLRGKDITLTIDARLQAYIAGLLGDKKGAIVCMNPFTGELLALASSPSFDPNRPEEYLNQPGSPYLNRAVTGEYAPGSIFKLVTAMCGLEENKITKTQSLLCSGSLQIGDSIFRCWKRDGHNEENLESAIIHSCNIFFFRLGIIVGPERLNEWASNFGLGKTTGVELPNESKGLNPSPAWKRMRFHGEKWFDGETANLAIGQGYSLITPLQAACMVSVIANGGRLVHPRLIKRIQDKEIVSRKARNVGCSKAHIDAIKNSMVFVVEDPSGTGHIAKTELTKIAAKTGTAQTHIQGFPHAWFIGFAPADNPKIAFSIFIEHGGSGGMLPAELAKKLVEYAIQRF